MKKLCLMLAQFLMMPLITQAEEWKTFQGASGYTVEYPSSWTIPHWATGGKRTESDMWEYVRTPDKTTAVLFVLGPADSQAFLGANTAEEFQARAKPVAVETLVDKEILEEASDRSGGKLKREKAKIAGIDGEIITGPQEKTYVFIDGPIYYRLIYSAETKEGFKNNFFVGDKIVSSFKPIPRDRVYQVLFEPLPK